MTRTPYYKILLDGKDMDDSIYNKIERVQFKEPEEGEQYFVISMKDHDYSIQDGDIFVVDKTVCTLYMGYVDNYDLMMTGLVQIITPDYPRNDSPTLEITIKSIASVMTREEKHYRYVDKTYSDIVIEISKKYGLTPSVDDTSYIYDPKGGNKRSSVDLKIGSKVKLRHVCDSSYGENKGSLIAEEECVVAKIVDTSRKAPYLVNTSIGEKWASRSDLTPIDSPSAESVEYAGVYQTGRSDYDFIKAMAKKIGYDFYIDSGTLYFKKSSVKNDVIQLEYRIGECNLLSFNPNITATNTGGKFYTANVEFGDDLFGEDLLGDDLLASGE